MTSAFKRFSSDSPKSHNNTNWLADGGSGGPAASVFSAVELLLLSEESGFVESIVSLCVQFPVTKDCLFGRY